MSVRGISFDVNGSEECILQHILNNIDVNELYWIISEDEVYSNEGKKFFNEKYIDGNTFVSKINETSYLLIFANIKAYSDASRLDNIRDYDNFLKSNCQLIILCSDMFNYEIYCKSESMIEAIKDNCFKEGYRKIEYITDDNDCRVVLSVE